MGKKRTILVVDDDDMNLQMAEFILKKEMDVDVVLAESGYKCIALLQKKMAVDLILLDIQMPRMDGIKTLETIRSHAEWKDIPVIFLTASADRHTVVKASQLKVDDYIKKPFTPADLVERVNKVMAAKMLDSPDMAKLFADLENLGK